MKKVWAVFEFTQVEGLSREVFTECFYEDTEKEAIDSIEQRLESGTYYDSYFILPKYIQDEE